MLTLRMLYFSHAFYASLSLQGAAAFPFVQFLCMDTTSLFFLGLLPRSGRIPRRDGLLRGYPTASPIASLQLLMVHLV